MASSLRPYLAKNSFNFLFPLRAISLNYFSLHWSIDKLLTNEIPYPIDLCWAAQFMHINTPLFTDAHYGLAVPQSKQIWLSGSVRSYLNTKSEMIFSFYIWNDNYLFCQTNLNLNINTVVNLIFWDYFYPHH